MKNFHTWSILIVFASIGCNGSSDSDDERDTADSEKDTTVDSDSGWEVASPYDDNSPYSVSVDGESVDVSRISRFDVPINFIRLDHSGDAETIAVTSKKPFSTYKLSPENRNIETEVSDNTVTFTLSEPGYFIFQPQSGESTVILERLLILVDPPEESPKQPDDSDVVNILDADGIDRTGGTVVTDIIQSAIDSVAGTGKTLYFPKGIYLTGELWMKDKMTLYLADGAILMGSDDLADIVTSDSTGSTVEQCLHALVRMYDVEDSHIKGRGILDANGVTHRVKENANTKYNLLKIEESKNCSVDGVTAIDSSFWNTIVYRSDSIQITNYKVINNWKSVGWNETDGVDFDNATNSTLSNALLYTGDDCMATKSDDIQDDYVTPTGVDNYPADPTTAGTYLSVDNIIHEKVVCFTNQSACKVGTKTMGTEMQNIVFRDIDVVKCGRGLVIDNMDTATVHDITYENIEFEYIAVFDAVYFIIQPGTSWRYSEGVGSIENIEIKNVKYNDFTMKPSFRFEGNIIEGESTNANAGAEEVVYPIGKVTLTDVYLDDIHLVDENVESHIRLITKAADDITFQ